MIIINSKKINLALILFLIIPIGLVSCASSANKLVHRIFNTTVISKEYEKESLTNDEVVFCNSNRFIDALAHEGLFSGTILVARSNKVIISKAYGYLNSKTKKMNSLETKYYIGSLTKQFTATAILILNSQKKLCIDDSISKYLDDIPERMKSITISQLLSHTSGIHNFTDTLRYNLASKNCKKISSDKLLEIILEMPLDFCPGEKFKYSNSGYILLGKIIEVVSDCTYGEYLYKNLFLPLNMNDTAFEVDTELVDNVAVGYNKYGFAYNVKDVSIPYSAGGLYSTVSDLLKWDQSLYGYDIISSNVINEMMSPKVQIEKTDDSYGFGWYISKRFNRSLIYHTGVINGFHSEIDRYIDDHVTIIVLSNKVGVDISDISAGLGKIVFMK